MALENEVGRYKVLLDTARCFGRAMDLHTLIDEILNRSQEVMRAEACSIFLPDRDTGELILHTTLGRIAKLGKPLRVPAGQGIAGAVFKSKQTLNIKDAQQDPRHYKTISAEVGFVTRAMITVPLLNGADCLGVMQAVNAQDRQCFDERDEEIFEGFGGMIVNALLRLEAQQREIDSMRDRQELLLAREIQETFLPPSLQEFPFCFVHLSYLPARVVGGDFSFVHPLSGHRLLLGLGDVSGKGVPAALTMARATAMIKASVGQIQNDLGEWVAFLNRQLVEDLRAGRFIGLTFLLADASSASVQLCAAGQFPPLHFNGQRWENHSVPNQLALGISPRARYGTQRVALRPGDSWLLFSDGIPEARNNAEEELTVQRFLASLPTDRSAAETMSEAIAAWRRFVNPNRPQQDDASLLLLDWRGLPPPAELSTLCCPENLRLGREFVEKWATFAGYDDVTVGKIVLACDEAVTNIFSHGYERKPGPLEYHAGIEKNCLSLRISDQAKSVDASKIKGRLLSDLRPGGLGTFIMSQVFDEVNYEPQAIGTTLILSKVLPGLVRNA